MKRTVAILVVVCAMCAQGAWYWPFGDRDSTNAPPRLHRLLQPVNDYIELAQDASLDGDVDKAIENYRLALGELDRIEAENPDRAATAEFAPIRSRRVSCNAAIDAIRVEQINDNARPVAVTDTTTLQKKWNKKHGIKIEDDEKSDPPKPATTNATPPKVETPRVEPPKVEPPKVEPPKTDAPKSVAPKTEPPKPEQPNPAQLPKDWDGRIAQAMEFLRAHDYAGADVLLESMMNERPKDLNAMLLRAAAQTGTKNHYAAQRTLERAMRTHPKSYLPYYNLANLMIQQGEDLDAAREYYELGRTVGGPVNKAIEAKLKGPGK